MSQSSKNKNYSWGNKVKPETSSFSRVISDLLGKQFSIFFVGISMVFLKKWLILPEKRFYYMENRIPKKCGISVCLCIVSECQM